MERIGDRLVAQGLIDRQQLAEALTSQRRDGGYLGQHLIDAGHVDRRDFYESLASLWSLSQRDLVACPPDPAVLAQVGVEDALERDWIPCEVTSSGLVVATAVRPSSDLVTEVEEHFPGAEITFVACTRRDLDAVAVTLARSSADSRRRDDARTLGPARRPEVRTRHYLAVIALGALVVLAAGVLPLDLVAVLVLLGGAVFLVGVGTQVVLGLISFSHELDAAPECGPSTDRRLLDAERADAELPLYSVLVRLGRDASAPVRANELVESLDYPRSRLDVLWLVDDDAAAVEAVAAVAPPECVRVVRIQTDGSADDARTFEHGLALARGRYLVAYHDTDRPDAAQLRLAVARFEHETAELLADRTGVPLLALRVHLRRVSARRATGRRSAYERLAGIDYALRLDRSPDEVCAALVGRDLRSTHFNMRLLRRAGGFQEIVQPLPVSTPAVRQPRVEELDSVTLGHALSVAEWLAERSRSGMVSMPGWAERSWQVVRSPQLDRVAAWSALRAASLPLMFLPLPPLVACAAVVGLRSRTEPSLIADGVAWLVIGFVVLVMGSVTMFTSVVLMWRRSEGAVVDLVLLPVYWVLAAFSFWAVSASLARSRRGSATATRHRPVTAW